MVRHSSTSSGILVLFLGCMGNKPYYLDKGDIFSKDTFKKERNFGFSKTKVLTNTVPRSSLAYYRRLGNGGISGRVPYKYKRDKHLYRSKY